LNYFTPDHVQVLSILAAHLAVSIENANLYEQLARDERRMERDLNAARRIQGALLPRLPGREFGLDIAARVVSSRELSGDLYDFLRYGPQDLGIALGDVSGKGSAAALYGAVAVGTLRSIGSSKPRPANMLRAVNGFLAERLIEGRFMTLCFATWNKRARRLRIANAGQEQPLLYRAGRCDKIPVAGFPLGIFDEVTYDERSYILNPGEIVLFYSDGIGDAQAAGGEFFGAARLGEIVRASPTASADGIADKILEAADAFSGGKHPVDDRTLVVLKCE
ncbi:MAG: PP2C family protein-serine/threonine phosphatase, partial [Acidobacteriota bacterium]|nr:PP2C family protein-serine/threonine phosphatase [Acidobacteriota bacterium]